MCYQVAKLFAATLDIGVGPLSGDNKIPLLGLGFAKLVDYCNALSLFGTKSAYEEIQKQKVYSEFSGLEDVYKLQVLSHHAEGRRDAWEEGWKTFVAADGPTAKFAKKPLFPRIGKGCKRVTNQDLLAKDSNPLLDNDGGNLVLYNTLQCPFKMVRMLN